MMFMCIPSMSIRIDCTHPYGAWERGNNENLNRLIRRFVSKVTALGKLAQSEVKRIEAG